MSETVAEKYDITFGDADGTPATVSGTGGKDRLQSGGSDGKANTDYQRFYGGEGSDTFTMREKDFVAAGTGVDKFIADFQGAGGWHATNNDFLQLTGFDAGSKLELYAQRAGSVEGSVQYYYHILDSEGVNQGNLEVQSINGVALGAGDYAFYA